MSTFGAARALVTGAVASRVFPCAVVEVGRARAPIWREAFGALTYDPDAPPARDDTLFDLASLTKPVATASLTMRLADDERLSIDDRVSRWLPAWGGHDRADVTLRDLLAHRSGLSAWLPLFRDYRGRAEFERAICTLPLEYRPRTEPTYSDLGFILLGFVVEDAGGAALDAQFRTLAAGFLEPDQILEFNPGVHLRPRIAPTEVDSWRGRLLVGEVHDENTWALGGTAGHSGLFGDAAAVGSFARAMLSALGDDPGAPVELLARRDTVRAFVARSGTPPGSSRALAWDTMLPSSSCGGRMSATAFGHTGFTGTSLWIDPEAGLYVVLLTNRVHPTRRNESIRQFRPMLHDAIMAAI